MQQNKHKAPYARARDTAFSLMMDVVIASLPLYFMAFYYYGPRVLVMGLVSVLAAMATDVICILLTGKKPYWRDVSSLVTGVLLPLMFSAATPYYVIITAAVFATAVVKHVFGGTGQSAFNPAAAGFAFASVCWPTLVFSYPVPFHKLPVFGAITEGLGTSPAWTLFQGGVPTNDLFDLVLGKYLGPMGLTNLLVLGACFLYLFFRRAIRWQATAAFFAVMALGAVLFPRVQDTGIVSLAYEFCTGMWVFGGIFMLNEPGTLPKRSLSRLCYGAFAGVMTLLFMHFGRFEQTFVFALLVTNVFGAAIDRFSEWWMRRLRRMYLAAREKVNEKAVVKRA